MLSIYYAQLKREFWEHKGVILWYPLIVSAIAISLVLVALLAFGDAEKTVSVSEDGTVSVQITSKPKVEILPESPSNQDLSTGNQYLLKSNATPKYKEKDYRKVAGFLFSMLCMDLAVFAIAIIGNGLASDRKDGSILFWRSMPVSERDNVLAKYFTALGVMPAFHILVSIIAIGIIAIMVLASESIYGSNAVMSGLSAALLLDYVKSVLLVPLVLLWLLPFFAWIGLVCSFTKKLAFVWIIAPFVLIPIIEGSLFRAHQYSLIVGLLKSYIDSGLNIVGAIPYGNWQAVDLLPGLAGLVLSAVLITATIYVRKIKID